MMQTLGVVQIRCGASGRLSYRRRIGGKSVLEWVVRRVTDCQQLDAVIIVVGDSQEEQDVARLAPADVPVYVSRERDPLARFVAAMDHYRAKHVVRVFADHPFLDPTLIDQLVTTARANPSCDYLTYCSRNGEPAIDSPLGVYAEWFPVKALRRADQRASTPHDRRDATAYLRAHPEEFPMRLVALPAAMDRDDVRLCLDGEEDWELTEELFDAIGPDHLDWQGIAHFLEHQPALRERMAMLNQAAPLSRTPSLR